MKSLIRICKCEIRILIVSILVTLSLSANAKTTYIPRYTTTMSLAIPGEDTIAVFNNNIEVEIKSSDGLFTATVYHDDLTLEKLKTIRRNKAAEGWAGFSAILSGFAYATADNFADRLTNYYKAETSAIIAGIYSANAEAANILGVELVIDNTSNEELSVNDMERGLIWHILPHRSLTLQMNNPDVAQLRIADSRDNRPHYLTVGAGSVMKPMVVIYEDEDYVVRPVYSDNESHEIDFYMLIDRRTLESQSMSPEEYKKFRKNRK